jgi:hypothetical protein
MATMNKKSQLISKMVLLQSGRRESNPHDQLGRSVLALPARCAYTYALVTNAQ